MELELEVATPAGERLPVAVEAGPKTSVGELAAALAALLPGAPSWPLYLGARRLAERVPLADTPIVTGALVSLGAPVPERHPQPADLEVAVVGGLVAGASVPAPAGCELRVGRHHGADIALSDPEVSRDHAQLRIGPDGRVELRDCGSSYGTGWAGYQLEGTAQLAPGDVFGAGETVLEVRRPPAPAKLLQRDPKAALLRFNRPPRIDAPAPPPELLVPAEPERPKARRFSLAAVLLPLLLGGALYLFARGDSSTRIYYLAFIALSPAMAVANFVSDHLGGRKEYRKQEAAYVASMAALDDKLAGLVAAEERAARKALPDPAAVVAIATAPTARLWERRAGDEDFLRLRLGLADRPARVRLRGEDRGDREPPRALLVPVSIDLPAAGVLGVAAPRAVGLSLVRALLAQTVALHSPRDLGLVLLTGADEAGDWEWCGWLPHTEPHLSVWQARRTVAVDARQGEARLAELRALIDERRQEQRTRLHAGPPAGRRMLLVLDGARRLRNLRGLAEVLHDGPAVGVYALCLDSDEGSLPDECGATAVVSSASGTRLVVRPPHGGAPVESVLADGLSSTLAERVARAAAPVRPLGDSAGGDGAVPDTVRFLDLAGMPQIGVQDVLAAWRASPEGRCTVALLGVGATGPVQVDLRSDGPHGLVAGTTGAGKSELLQTLIASLAVANRPDAMTFVLVDYKGGSAFKECRELPHCVGLVTDLDGHLADRALVSLDAELKRRERLFAAVDAKDIEDYWARTGGRLPRLAIVIDEFATLVKEVPHFVDGVVDIGRRGRSLGVHIVLATQRPAGVVSDEMRANVSLRICLRVTSAHESTDVIDAADAERISKRTRGRAYLRTGHGELTLFQAARVGCPQEDAATPGHEATRVAARRRYFAELGDAPTLEDGEVQESGATDLGAIVEAVGKAAAQLGMQAPASPWLPPLPEVVTVAELGGGASHDMPVAVPVGLADHPAEQAQVPFVLDLERTGSVLVAGSVRSGRSTVLRTLAGALAAHASPADVHLYALDCGNHALAALAALPHCGAVVAGDDTIRVERLLGMLTAEVTQRQRALAANGFSSLAEQRAAEPECALPHLVVLLDRMETFHASYLELDGGRLVDQVEHLLRHGPAVGVSLVIAADRTGVPHRLAGALESRLVLRQADRDGYAFFGIDPRRVPTAMPSGRGLWVASGEEVQVALLDADPAGASQAEAVRTLGGEATGRHHVPPERLPRRVDPLPERITLAELTALRRQPVQEGDAVCTVAAGGDELGPVDLDLVGAGACFVVAGPPQSGRSTALECIVRSLRGREPGTLPVLVVTPRPSPLRELVGLPGVIDVLEQGPDLAGELDEILGDRNRPLAVVVDDAELLADGPVGIRLERLVRSARDEGVLVIAAATTQDLLLARYRGWLADARRARAGLLLNPATHIDGEVFDLKLSRSLSGRWPAGRGFLVVRGASELVQVPTP
jgi:S-DNA-T family DNA segregation ATPase FtsK/SpoIIIE